MHFYVVSLPVGASVGASLRREKVDVDLCGPMRLHRDKHHRYGQANLELEEKMDVHLRGQMRFHRD